MIVKPHHLDTSEYFAGYVRKASGNDLLASLSVVCSETADLLSELSDDQANYRYAEGKWTIKQVVQHLIDTERVFAYRALSIARGDQQNLCGFDEDEFALNDQSKQRKMEDIIAEYRLVRASTIALFGSFSHDVLDNRGLANQVAFTPRILGWVLVGHDQHHLSVIKERYLGN